MKIELGNNIRKLRTEQCITQEQLAEALSVSPQSVSRWENGTTYPDITVLPVLANYFDVTTDTLLGVDFINKQKEIDAIFEKNGTLRQQGKTYESICYLREKVQEYPTHAKLHYELAASLYSYCFQSGLTHSKQEIDALAKEAAKMCKKALQYSKDSQIANLCKTLLAYTYIKLGECNKAKEIADTMPSIPNTHEFIYPRTLPKEEAYIEYQKNLLHFMNAIDYTLRQISSHGNYSREQKLEISLLREKVIFTLTGESSYAWSDVLFHCAKDIAYYYWKLGDKEQVLINLKKCLEYAKAYQNGKPHGYYNTAWLSGCQYNRNLCTKHSNSDLYDDLYEMIIKEGFEESFRHVPQFMNLIKELEERRNSC